jgi:hypothetical protein
MASFVEVANILATSTSDTQTVPSSAPAYRTIPYHTIFRFFFFATSCLLSLPHSTIERYVHIYAAVMRVSIYDNRKSTFHFTYIIRKKLTNTPLYPLRCEVSSKKAYYNRGSISVFGLFENEKVHNRFRHIHRTEIGGCVVGSKSSPHALPTQHTPHT